MTNFQNPLGSTLPREKKRALVALLSNHEVPLIEDDVYGELYHNSDGPLVGQDLRPARLGDALLVVLQDAGAGLQSRMGRGRPVRP